MTKDLLPIMMLAAKAQNLSNCKVQNKMRILLAFLYFAVCPVSLQRLISPLTGLINCHWQTSEFV